MKKDYSFSDWMAFGIFLLTLLEFYKLLLREDARGSAVR